MALATEGAEVAGIQAYVGVLAYGDDMVDVDSGFGLAAFSAILAIGVLSPVAIPDLAPSAVVSPLG